jgi:dihydroorotate dehydrogenase
MNGAVISTRNAVLHTLYKNVLKPFFFMNDPEMVHDTMVKFGKTLGSVGIGRMALSGLFNYSNPLLEQDILGIHFKNPIGLAAGFDKNADLIEVIPSVGFGFIEVGSITGKACAGNPKPRLWRLAKSKGLVVWYGLKNDGCEVLSEKIKKIYHAVPVGTSVAMTNCSDNLNTRNAISDYAKAFRSLSAIGAYTTVNISCPNAEGGQPFMAPHKLDYLFDILDTIPTGKPVFVKMSPDMAHDQIDEILDVLKKHRVAGIIATNLTKRRDNPKILETLPPVGGVSGKPVRDASDALIEHIYKREGNRFIIVGCGGVFSAEDAYRKIKKGASLIQMITGMIFEGPQIISHINQGLSQLLKRDGFSSIADAVGTAVSR